MHKFNNSSLKIACIKYMLSIHNKMRTLEVEYKPYALGFYNFEIQSFKAFISAGLSSSPVLAELSANSTLQFR